MTKIAGVILAGGRATRMGGGDKGLRPIGDRRLIDHVIDRLAPQCNALVINANGDADRFDEFGLPVVADSAPSFAGPLAGILAGMDWAQQHGFDAIVSAAADTPFFPLDLVSQLQAATGPKGLAIAASRDDKGTLWRQPTFGLWPVALRDDLRKALGDGLRKIVLWTDAHEAGTAEFTSDGYDPFFNVNTPEDIENARHLLEKL